MTYSVEMPPQDIDSEKQLLGRVILEPANMQIVSGIVDPSMFYFDIHGAIYSAVQNLTNGGSLPTAETVLLAIDATGIGDQLAGGFTAYLLDLLDVPHTGHCRYYAAKVRQKWSERQRISRADALARLVRDPGADPNEISRCAEEVAKYSQPAAVSAFATLTSANLDAADLHTQYLVDHVLAAGQPCVLAAGKKTLKTTFAIDLQLSLASGAKFLNEFYVPKAVRVALMSGESGDATIQETARRIAKSKPWVNLSDYSNAVWSFDLPRLGQPQTKRDLSRFIGDNGLEVLMIDPAYLCLDLGDDAGNLFSVGKKLMDLTEVGHDTKCTIILVHHCRKSSGQDQFAAPELESISWSGFQEWARQWILLGRREAYNPDAAGSHKLWLSVGGSAGHSGLWGVDIEEGSRADKYGRRWEVSIDGASKVIAAKLEQGESAKDERAKSRADRQIAADASKMLDTMRQWFGNGETERGIRERAGVPGSRAPAAMAKLLQDGSVESCDVEKLKRKYPGFRPVQSDSGTSGTQRDITGTTPIRPSGLCVSGTIPLRGVSHSHSHTHPHPDTADRDEFVPVDFDSPTSGRPA